MLVTFCMWTRIEFRRCATLLMLVLIQQTTIQIGHFASSCLGWRDGVILQWAQLYFINCLLSMSDAKPVHGKWSDIVHHNLLWCFIGCECANRLTGCWECVILYRALIDCVTSICALSYGFPSRVSHHKMTYLYWRGVKH